MPRKFFKFKLLLDENIPTRQHFPLLNSRFDIKHIVADYKEAAISDPAVYQRARKEGRLLLTYNIKDFKDLAHRSKNTGVIGISANLTPSIIDKKLTSFLTKVTQKELFGKFTYISGESES